FQIRSRWRWIPEERIIEVYEIPYTTKTDVIIERIVKLSKEGKVREISDIRDETDLSGLRIAIDVKRGVDPEKLMAKLFKTTTLQDSFSCNFNVLVDGYPRVMGVRQILHEWVAWRMDSTRRRMNFDLAKKSERLHLLHGLEAILLDIDKAIAIIRGTKLEAEVVPNLMKGFGIDETQAEFVAEIKLRNINEEYILNRTKDIEKLEGEIAELEDILSSEDKIKQVISDELAAVNKKYVTPRRTGRVDPADVVEVSLEPEVEEYPVTIMLSRDGYLKKMTDRVLKKASSLKYKDGDKPFIEFPSSNTHELLVFTDKSQVYKCKVSQFEDTKSAQLGSYLPTDLEMEPDENVIWVIDPEDYKADVLFAFENGRVVRVALAGYVTKTNRKRLKNAIYGGSKLLFAQVLKEDRDLALVSNDGRLMNFNTSLLKTKTTTNTQGVQAFTAKKGRIVTAVGAIEDFLGSDVWTEKFCAQALPCAGALMKESDMPSLFD
ncbi:DNA gyrase subunit A, partial [Parolsenella catena]|uniref:DNA gyrase subunit A n=1 Tax=Parolsenella catena TaxID=2003188 RepID=UPI003077BDA6